MTQTQKPSRILVVDFTQNVFGQANTVDTPTSLWRLGSRSVVEVFVLCFQKSIINFVQFPAKDLLGSLIAVRRSIGRKQDSILILVEKLTRRAWLSSQLTDASSNIDIHIGIAVQTGRNVRQVLGISDMKRHEFRAGMSRHYPVARFL